jgi:hypothetical protein
MPQQPFFQWYLQSNEILLKYEYKMFLTQEAFFRNLIPFITKQENDMVLRFPYFADISIIT